MAAVRSSSHPGSVSRFSTRFYLFDIQYELGKVSAGEVGNDAYRLDGADCKSTSQAPEDGL